VIEISQLGGKLMKNKWQLFHKQQRERESRPILVKQAMKSGWTNIKAYPNGYSNIDSCGCCFTDYKAGWYGHDANGRYRIICDNEGHAIDRMIAGTSDIINCC